MGRDLRILWEWEKNGQIPLLGPQTSALPINQSPIYYYFLMPFYLLSNHSPYSALLVNALFYLVCFLIGLYLTKNNPLLTKATLVIFLFFIFHPQHVLQNRFVWNPSLLPPLIFLSLIFLLLFLEKSQKKQLFFSCLLISLAVSLHYSVFPLLAIFLIIIIFQKPNFFRLFIFYLTFSLVLFNISVLGQLVKKIVVTGTLFRPDQIYQTDSSFSLRLTDYLRYVFAIRASPVSIFMVGLIFLFCLCELWFSSSKMKKTVVLIFLGTSIFALLSPFNLLAHYIFPITTSLFLLLGFHDWKKEFILIPLLLINYLRPNQVSGYFQPAPRTYQQMDSCFRQFCSQFKEPLFVSVQSDLYPYHYGPEHRYLMAKNGCAVKNIEENPGSVEYMAVVLDSSSFSAGTRYYELDLFGKYQQALTLNCQPNFAVLLLKKEIPD